MTRPGIRPVATTAVAGWLFADLLAALVLILLGTGVSPAHRPVRRPPTPTPTPSAPARPGPAPAPAGVSIRPVTVELSLPAGVGGLRRELAGVRRRFAGRHAGIVLTFGAGDESSGPVLAGEINSMLRKAYPDVFGGAVMRDFFGPQPHPQTASVEIYLITSG